MSEYGIVVNIDSKDMILSDEYTPIIESIPDYKEVVCGTHYKNIDCFESHLNSLYPVKLLSKDNKSYRVSLDCSLSLVNKFLTVRYRGKEKSTDMSSVIRDCRKTKRFTNIYWRAVLGSIYMLMFDLGCNPFRTSNERDAVVDRIELFVNEQFNLACPNGDASKDGGFVFPRYTDIFQCRGLYVPAVVKNNIVKLVSIVEPAGPEFAQMLDDEEVIYLESISKDIVYYHNAYMIYSAFYRSDIHSMSFMDYGAVASTSFSKISSAYMEKSMTFKDWYNHVRHDTVKANILNEMTELVCNEKDYFNDYSYYKYIAKNDFNDGKYSSALCFVRLAVVSILKGIIRTFNEPVSFFEEDIYFLLKEVESLMKVRFTFSNIDVSMFKDSDNKLTKFLWSYGKHGNVLAVGTYLDMADVIAVAAIKRLKLGKVMRIDCDIDYDVKQYMIRDMEMYIKTFRDMNLKLNYDIDADDWNYWSSIINNAAVTYSSVSGETPISRLEAMASIYG